MKGINTRVRLLESKVYNKNLQRKLFVYLINKYTRISLSDICLTVHHLYK